MCLTPSLAGRRWPWWSSEGYQECDPRLASKCSQDCVVVMGCKQSHQTISRHDPCKKLSCLFMYAFPPLWLDGITKPLWWPGWLPADMAETPPGLRSGQCELVCGDHLAVYDTGEKGQLAFPAGTSFYLVLNKGLRDLRLNHSLVGALSQLLSPLSTIISSSIKEG